MKSASTAALNATAIADLAQFKARTVTEFALNHNYESSGTVSAHQKSSSSPVKARRPTNYDTSYNVREERGSEAMQLRSTNSKCAACGQTSPSSTKSSQWQSVTRLEAPETPDAQFRAATLASTLRRLASGAGRVAFPRTPLKPDEVPILCDALRNHASHLTELSARRTVPNHKWFEQLIEAIKDSDTIQTVDIASNAIGSNGKDEPNLSPLEKLKQFIDTCETLTSLDIADNLLGPQGVEIVCQGARESVGLRILNLSSNQLGGAEEENPGVEAMKEMLLKNKFLHTLSLRDNDIQKAQVDQMAEVLSSGRRLTSLDLSQNKLGSLGAIALAGIVKANKSIKDLQLSENKIGWKGIVALCSALQENQKIERVVISKNNFGTVKIPVVEVPKTEEEGEGEVDPEELAERQKQEKTAHDKLVGNAEKAVQQIAEVLRTSQTLQALDIAYNDIGPQQMALIARQLKSNSTLTSINLSMNSLCGTSPQEESLDMTALSELAAALGVNTTLQSLNLRWNFLMDTGFSTLAQGIAANPSPALTKLDLSRNFIRDGCLGDIRHFFGPTSQLKSLNLSHNYITEVGVASLLENGVFSGPLQELNISNNPIGNTGWNLITMGITNAENESPMRTIIASKCDLDDETLYDTTNMLRSEKCRLKTLFIADNHISSEFVVGVLAAAESCLSLENLSVWGRHDHEENRETESALRCLQANTNLRSLQLGVTQSVELLESIDDTLSTRWP